MQISIKNQCLLLKALEALEHNCPRVAICKLKDIVSNLEKEKESNKRLKNEFIKKILELDSKIENNN